MDLSPGQFLLFRFFLAISRDGTPIRRKAHRAGISKGVAMWPAAAFPWLFRGRPGSALGNRSESKPTISCVQVPDEIKG
jgi:hypothetical protein